MSNEETNNSGSIILKINNVDNAAFVDYVINSEISRIIDVVAAKVEWIEELTDIDFVLRDVNGNNIGHINYFRVDDEPEDDPETVISLSIELGNAAFDDAPGVEIARILREVSGKVRDGIRYFSILDVNGNTVGNFEWKKAK